VSGQINLFSTAYRVKSKPFSAVWIVSGAAIVVAVILAYYALQARQLASLRTARTTSEAQIKQLRDQVAAAGQRTRKTQDKALEDQVAGLDALVKSRQELFIWLQTGQVGNREGYAKILTALARQHLEGVWLTGIEISGPQSDFIVKGRAVRADLLPDYIKILRNEEAFRGKSISALQLTEGEIDPNTDQKTATGVVNIAPAAAKMQAERAPRPRIRVVEFAIGSDAAAAAKGAASR
jgi:hypothetical protein